MRFRARIVAAAAALVATSAAIAAGPSVVNGPGENPACFKPWDANTKYFQWPAKKGPYRIALANGFVGNTWRIQMIKMAKAYAATPEMKSQIKEFKIVSTGTDVAAQIAAIDNFINSGYDAIVTIAVNPTAFAPVIKRANAAGVVVVPFDNVLDSDQVMMVNEDQLAMGQLSGDWVVKNIPSKSGKLLEVRGVPGNSVDRDRHLGFRKVVEAPGNKFEVVEVVGNWDDGTAQKAVADAAAVHKNFDGMFVQGGSTGAVRALIDAKHKMIPVAGEAENGFRKLCVAHAKEGLLCASLGQSPGLVAISMKAAVTALQGKVMPQMISVPIPMASHPDFKAGENYFPDLTDNFFTTNDFPPCGVTLKATDIMSKDEKNNYGSALQPILQLVDVSKRYGGVRALEHASFACAPGRIHALLGENGAGKSTLIKILAGVVQPDEGRIVLEGAERRFAHPQEAVSAGIACIFQELSLMPDLSVADNICITNPPLRHGLIDRKAQRRIAEAALARAGAEDIHPLAPVESLTLSRRQMVEISKALARDPKILILDEATSALTAADVRRVFALLKRWRNEGLAIVYISHRMNEITELADECSVFRNGSHVATFEAGTRSNAETIEMMIGRDIEHAFPPKPAPRVAPDATTPALETRGLSWNSRLHDIDIAVRPGEIVGLGGLDRQGQRELFLALFGVLRGVSGEVLLAGKPTQVHGPKHAKSSQIGIAMVPEDRKTDGLMLPMSVNDNLSLAALDRLSRAGVLVAAAEADAVAGIVRRLSIKVAETEDAVGTLSGGNQQKVVIGKWLINAPRILLLSDPTRGIDVGTKQEIYALVRALADEGAAVMLYSTDYAELIGCCDRVAVFFDGRIVRWLAGAELTEHALVSSALNLETAAA